jgi:hypothetical protein
MVAPGYLSRKGSAGPRVLINSVVLKLGVGRVPG